MTSEFCDHFLVQLRHKKTSPLDPGPQMRGCTQVSLSGPYAVTFYVKILREIVHVLTCRFGMESLQRAVKFEIALDHRSSLGEMSKASSPRRTAIVMCSYLRNATR